MKKGRPGIVLSALARPGGRARRRRGDAARDAARWACASPRSPLGARARGRTVEVGGEPVRVKSAGSTGGRATSRPSTTTAPPSRAATGAPAKPSGHARRWPRRTESSSDDSLAELERRIARARLRDRRLLRRRGLLARRRPRRARARRARARDHRRLARAGGRASSTARARWPRRSASRTRRSPPTSWPATATARNGRDRCYHCKTELYEHARGDRAPSAATRPCCPAPTPTTPATGAPACARRPSTACCTRCSRQGWQGRRARARRAARRAQRRASRRAPAWPRGSPTAPPVDLGTLRRIDRAERAVKALGYEQSAGPPPRRAGQARAAASTTWSGASASSRGSSGRSSRPATAGRRSIRSRSAPARSIASSSWIQRRPQQRGERVTVPVHRGG